MSSMEADFWESLAALAERRDDFVVLDGDIAGHRDTNIFCDKFPDRYIQCGIAEQNMFSVAAGISTTGIIPIVTCTAASLMRATEQVKNSLASPDCNVKIAVSRLGFEWGFAGETLQSLEDIFVFGFMSNVAVFSPADSRELAVCLPVLFDIKGPVYLRVGMSTSPPVYGQPPDFKIGKSNILRHGDDVTVLAVGAMVHKALEAARNLSKGGISCRVINVSSLRPLDSATVVTAAKETGALVTAEEHTGFGGLAGAIAECLVSNEPVPMEQVAVNDLYSEVGILKDIAQKHNLMPVDIQGAVYRVMARKSGSSD